MSNNLTDRLAELARSYLRQLSDRVDELAGAYEGFMREPSNREHIEQLRLIAHKIAGSGATFGFADITDYGRLLETKVSTLLESRAAPEDSALAEIRAAYHELCSACSTASMETASGFDVEAETESDGTNGEGERRSIVIAAIERSEAISELADQLGFFGYEVTFVSTLSALRLFAESNPESVAVIHTEFAGSCAESPGELSALLREVKHEFHYVFVSDRSDYHARLSALRAGGEAYFVLPIDITRVLDALESLTGRAEVAPYHVLIVDDDPEQVSYYALLLQQEGMITSVASDPKRILDLLSESKPELILMDMYMPGCTGTELLSIIRQQEAFVNVPIVFLSVEGDQDRQLQAIRRGADGFITKPADPEYLVAMVSNRLSRTRSIRYFMERDSLTGLLNHSNLREQLLRELLRAERASMELSFAMIDLDHFKHVNDTYGHLTGDKVLKSLSRLLLERLRRTDIIGRYGGEEFGVVLLNTGEQDAARILDEIRRNFERIRHQGEEGAFYVTFSCGVSEFPRYGDIESLTRAADETLYRAKEAGRNRVLTADSEDL